MKDRTTLFRSKFRQPPAQRARHWKTLAASHGVVGTKALSELKNLVRLARPPALEYSSAVESPMREAA